MLRTNTALPVFLLACLLIPAVTRAQTPVEDIATLPTTLSAEHFRSLLHLSVDLTPHAEPLRLQARRRLPERVPPLTPEGVSYKLAVQNLGVDEHRFVHVDLRKRKVRTGGIPAIREHGFVLKDGILNSQWISYADLQAAPRAVPVIGTRIGKEFKWIGLGVGMVAILPLVPFWPMGMAADGSC